LIIAVTSDEQGRPALEGSFHSADERGVSVGGIVADSIAGNLRFSSGVLELQRLQPLCERSCTGSRAQ